MHGEWEFGIPIFPLESRWNKTKQCILGMETGIHSFIAIFHSAKLKMLNQRQGTKWEWE